MNGFMTFVATVGLGAAGLRLLRIRDPFLDRNSFEIAALAFWLGFGLAGLIAFAVGVWSLLAASVVFVGIAIGSVVFFNPRRLAPRTTSGDMPDLFVWHRRLAQATLAIAGMLAIVGSLAPVTSWDAAVAHLAAPSDYAREGRIHAIAGNVYGAYPQLFHMLVATIYQPFRESDAALFCAVAGVMSCVSVAALGQRAANRSAGWIAGAALASAPIFMDQASTVAIDLVFAGMVCAALTALLRWYDERRWRWLIVAAFIAGSACGIRHTGYLVCALLLPGVAVFGAGRRVFFVLLFSGVAALAAAPWLAWSWHVSGNPVFPFLSVWLPSATIDHIDVSTPGAHESIAATGGFGWLALLRFPWDIVMKPMQYDGWTKSPGGLAIALGIPGLLIGGGRARLLGAFSGAGLAAFFFFQRFARYLLPFFLPMMAVAGTAVTRLPRLRWVTLIVLAGLFAEGLVMHAAAMHFKIPVILRQQSRDDYLASRVERYPAFVYANERLNDGGTILIVDQRSYYIDAPTYQNHWGMLAISDWDIEAQHAWLKERGIRYVMIPWLHLENATALREKLSPMFKRWKVDRERFAHIERIVTPRVRAEGVEQVDVLEVR